MPKITLPLPDLAQGQASIVTAGEKRLLVCRSALGIRVMDEICPHQDKSLEGGKVRQGTIMCPHHGARFSLEDGRSMAPALTTKPIILIPCSVNGDMLEIDL